MNRNDEKSKGITFPHMLSILLFSRLVAPNIHVKPTAYRIDEVYRIVADIDAEIHLIA